MKEKGRKKLLLINKKKKVPIGNKVQFIKVGSGPEMEIFRNLPSVKSAKP